MKINCLCDLLAHDWCLLYGNYGRWIGKFRRKLVSPSLPFPFFGCCFRSIAEEAFLRLECAQKSPGVLVNAGFGSIGLVWGLSFCISNKLPGDADAASPRFWWRECREDSRVRVEAGLNDVGSLLVSRSFESVPGQTIHNSTNWNITRERRRWYLFLEIILIFYFYRWCLCYRI